MLPEFGDLGDLGDEGDEGDLGEPKPGVLARCFDWSACAGEACWAAVVEPSDTALVTMRRQGRRPGRRR